jgi:hypothetical protein
MALIEDMFKGNLAAGLAIGVGAIILGPTAIRTLAGVLRPGGEDNDEDNDKERYGFLPRNPERDRGNGDRSRRRGESRARSGGWRRPAGAREDRIGGGATASRYRLNESAVIPPRRRSKQRADQGLRRLLDDGFDERGGHHAPESIHLGTVSGGLRTVLRNVTQTPQLFPQIAN